MQEPHLDNLLNGSGMYLYQTHLDILVCIIKRPHCKRLCVNARELKDLLCSEKDGVLGVDGFRSTGGDGCKS